MNINLNREGIDMVKALLSDHASMCRDESECEMARDILRSIETQEEFGNHTNYFVYGMRLRGFSPGCQPMDGLVERLDPMDAMGRRYYDLIAYSRQLTDKEVNGYDLDYIGEFIVKAE